MLYENCSDIVPLVCDVSHYCPYPDEQVEVRSDKDGVHQVQLVPFQSSNTAVLRTTRYNFPILLLITPAEYAPRPASSWVPLQDPASFGNQLTVPGYRPFNHFPPQNINSTNLPTKRVNLPLMRNVSGRSK